MISHVHHINFIVRDVQSAVAQYQDLLGLSGFIFDSLTKRGVITARLKLGSTWLVLVQPINEQGAPAEYLRKFGEGFFLMSLATDDLEAQLELFEKNFAASKPLKQPRLGLKNWTVNDLPIEAFFGAQLQLTQEASD